MRAAHITGVSTDISPAAKARQDSARRPNGEFGTQQHQLPDVVLPAEDPARKTRRAALEAAAEARDTEYLAAFRTMNDSRTAIAALNLEDDGVAVGRIRIMGDEQYWFVSEASAPAGTALDDADMISIGSAMKDAGVKYDPRYLEGVDLAALADHEDVDDSPAGYVDRLVDSAGEAFKAAGIEDDTPETMARDLLTNIRHWADANDVDLDQALEGSYRVYVDEAAVARAWKNGDAA